MENWQPNKQMFSKISKNTIVLYLILLLPAIIIFATGCQTVNKNESGKQEANQTKVIDENKEINTAEKVVADFIELSIKKEKEKALELKAENKLLPPPSPDSDNSVQYASKGSSVKGAADFLSVFPLSDYNRDFLCEKFDKDNEATMFVTFTNPNRPDIKFYMRFFLVKEKGQWKIAEADDSATPIKSSADEKLNV